MLTRPRYHWLCLRSDMTINGSAASTRIRYKHKSNKGNGKDPQAKLEVGFTCMLCWVTFLKVQNFPNFT